MSDDDATTAAPLPVHHLAVTVRDLERAERFYGDLLGLPLMRRWHDAAGAPRSIWFALGGGAFLAVERAEAEPSAGDHALRPGWHCVALGIPRGARATWQARLESAGHAIERATDFTIYTRDPEGNLIAFSHYPEPRGG